MRSILILSLLLPGCSGSLVYLRTPEGEGDPRRVARAGNPHAEIHRVYRMARQIGFQNVGSPRTTNLENGLQVQTVELRRTRWVLRSRGQSVAGDMQRRLTYSKLPEKERLQHMRRIDSAVQLWWVELADTPTAGKPLLPHFKPSVATHPQHREVAFLGKDRRVAWFVYAPIPTWIDLQRSQKLTGGSDATTAALRGLAVKDTGGWTAFSSFDLLGNEGPRAIKAVEALIAAKKPQRGSAIRAVGRHPDGRIAEILVKWSSSPDPAVAGAARRALIEVPRPAAGALYEQWIAAEAGKKKVLDLLRAIQKADVRRTVPHLQKVLARPESVAEYRLAFALTRDYVGPELPATLAADQDLILKHGFRGNGREPDSAKVDESVARMIKLPDAEAVAVAGLRLALFVSKGDYRVVNAAGIRILKKAPKRAGLTLLAHLAKTLYGTDLLKVQKLATVVRGMR